MRNKLRGMLLQAGCVALLAFGNVSHAASLHENPLWRSLLVYGDGEASALKSESFFLSENGATDPAAELKATVEAMQSPVQMDANGHAQCRFPARRMLIERYRPEALVGAPSIICSDFFDFSADAESVSLIFATGYLGNPASYYGHLLFKVNKPGVQTSLEDTAINFGAAIPPNENMLLYIAKGITGGYSSSFTHREYHYHANNYGNTENRDLWEYQIDLPEWERQLLIAHAWEQLGQDSTYYFFNRNCAYRMAELIETITGRRTLVDNRRPWVAPQSVMQALGEVSYRGRPVVQSIKHHPSLQSVLYGNYASLTPVERRWIAQAVATQREPTPQSLQDFAASRQYLMVDTLISYYQFRRDKAAGVADPNNERYREALSLRYRLPPAPLNRNANAEKQPHLGRKLSYVSIAGAHVSNDTSYGEVWIRPAYYDALDASRAHVPHSALSMGELRLGLRAGDVFVRDLNIVKIDSIASNVTGLPGDRQHSWSLAIGARQQALGCYDCLAAKAFASMGLARSTASGNVAVVAGMKTGYLGRRLDSEHAYVAPTLTVSVADLGPVSIFLSGEHRRSKAGVSVNRIELALRLALARNADLRLEARAEDENEIRASAGFYW